MRTRFHDVNAEMPAWSQVLFQEHWRHIAIHGGRGSSKSHSVARALLIRASQKTLRVLCAREIRDSIKKSVKQLLDDCIEAMGLRWFYTSTDSEIRGRNGSLFIFAGLLRNIDSVKSMEGVDICWVEEAQSVSQRSIDVLVPTIRKAGSQIIWVWNPTKQSDPVDKMFRAGKRMPDECVLEVNHKDNPWFTDELKAEMLRDKQRDPDRYRHVWCGGYLTRSKASIFTDWRIVNDDTAPSIPAALIPRYGADWGFMNDPTVLVRCWVMENTRTIYVDHCVHGVGIDIVDTPALFAQVPDSERHLIVADSARPETISHMRKAYNKRISPAVKGPGSIEEGIKFLLGYTILVHQRCDLAIEHLENYKRKTDPKTGEILDDIEDDYADFPDALRYAVEGDRRAPKPPPIVRPIPIATRWR